MFTEKELTSITTTVSSIVVELGAIVVSGFQTILSVEEKTSPHDVVTKYDKEGEDFIYNKLSTLYPEFGFLGEEQGYRNYDEKKPFWIVDPIDGTLNFARGIPCFAISVALVFGSKTYAGICYNPISKELFTAKRGFGALLNMHPIKASDTECMSRAMVSIAPEQYSPKKPGCVVRRLGSSVLDICYVAKGSLDGYYDSCLNPWDFAAASLIADEAGADVLSLKSKSLDTNKKSDILVASKNFTKEFIPWISTEPKSRKE